MKKVTKELKQHKYLFIIATFFLFFGNNIWADSSSDIDNLLANIEEKSDLSLRTRQENTGVYYIYTRHDLDAMQIKHLSDVLKATEIGYKESRYGVIDPFGFFSSAPFNSSMIKIFIDNQEISSALYGSGLATLGDMDLGFVDHIEIYAQNPSYEYSSEPAMVTIKLYSKKANRDAGGKITLSGGSYNNTLQSFQYVDTLKKYSYLFYFSRDDNRKKSYYIDNVGIKRDIKSYNLFTSIYNNKEKLMIKASKVDQGGLFGISLDAKPKDSDIKTDTFHIGYERDIENFHLSFIYDNIKNKTTYTENILTYFNMLPISSFFVKSSSQVYTAKMKYTFNYKNNKMIAGDKFRYKHFIYDNIKVNGVELPRYGHTKQKVNTLFLENNFNYIDNAIIWAGVSYSNISNNGNVPSYHTFLYRFGHTYLKDNWTVKAFFSHTELAIDPYLINSIYVVPGKMLKKQKLNSITLNIKYKKEHNQLETILGYLKLKNFIAPNSIGLLDNSKKDIKGDYAHLRWLYHYKPLNKLSLSFIYEHLYDLSLSVDDLKMYRGVLRNINQIGKYESFEELIYNRNNLLKKDYYDLSMGIKYNINNKFSIGIKGVNLLDRAEKFFYRRINTTTLKPMSPFLFSPTDRRVLLTLEWYF